MLYRSKDEDHKNDAKTNYTVSTEIIKENSERVEQRSKSKVSTPVTKTKAEERCLSLSITQQRSTPLKPNPTQLLHN